MDGASKRVNRKAKNFSDINIVQPRNEFAKAKSITSKSDKPKEKEKASTNAVKKSSGTTTKNAENSNTASIVDMQSAVVTARNVEFARSRFLSLIGVERRDEPANKYTVKDEKAADRIARDFAERL
uniref:Uncharacterized protein n=1 Tax=Plectus sambesii TaxID=2011161 RepID=A0A914VTC6_9BILA